MASRAMMERQATIIWPQEKGVSAFQSDILALLAPDLLWERQWHNGYRREKRSCMGDTFS
jgi:hypothetical protein